MQKLRSIHLYLGCVFAPILLFFAVSGMWQMLGLGKSGIFRALSSIHTQHHYKDGSLTFASPVLLAFVLLMSASFIITTALGVVMALKYGRSRKSAIWCLVLGVVIPVGMIVVHLLA